MKSTDVAQSPRLRFESAQDTLDHVNEIVEHLKHRRTTDHLDFVKRYEEGDVHLVLNVGSDKDGDKFDLLIRAIPGVHRHANKSTLGHLEVPELAPIPTRRSVLCLSATHMSLSAHRKSFPPRYGLSALNTE